MELGQLHHLPAGNLPDRHQHQHQRRRSRTGRPGPGQHLLHPVPRGRSQIRRHQPGLVVRSRHRLRGRRRVRLRVRGIGRRDHAGGDEHGAAGGERGGPAREERLHDHVHERLRQGGVSEGGEHRMGRVREFHF